MSLFKYNLFIITNSIDTFLKNTNMTLNGGENCPFHQVNGVGAAAAPPTQTAIQAQ